MGRGKANLKKNPTPGRADRKVVLEYSSDETPDENAPQTGGGSGGTKMCEEADSPHPANEPSPHHYYRNLRHLFSSTMT